jgi:putative transposase
VSIRYTERLAKAGIEPSVGSVGDAHDNALAETINGLYKTEVIRRRSSWKTMEEVELETLKWPYCDASIAYRLTDRLVQQQAPA